MRLEASLLGRLLAATSPLVLLVLGSYGLATSGVAGPAPWLVAGGLLLAAGAGAMLPWATEVDADGLSCRSLLRRRNIPWDDVVAFERHGRRPGGPLVVRTTARKRIALTDVVERPDAWDRLRELIAAHAPGVVVPPPPPTHPFAHHHGRKPGSPLRHR